LKFDESGEDDAGRRGWKIIQSLPVRGEDAILEADLEGLELGRHGESDGEIPRREVSLWWDLFQSKRNEVCGRREEPW